MTTLLPQDLNDNPIPALRMKSGGAHSIAAGGARNGTQPHLTQTHKLSAYTPTCLFISPSGIIP